MKRKIYAILIASIIIGAGAVISTGAVDNTNLTTLNSVKKENKPSNLISSNDNMDFKIILKKIPTEDFELKEQYYQYHKSIPWKDKKTTHIPIIGRWGYSNNPESEGELIANYDGRKIRGIYSITDTKSISFQVTLYKKTFSGCIYIHQYLKSTENEPITQAFNVISIYGSYCIDDGHITAFWSEGFRIPTYSSIILEEFDFWFFGEIN